VTLFSNGTLIDEARADRLASFPLAGVEVSLHGGDAQMHDRIVGQPGAFMRTLRAIDRLEARGVKLLVKMSVMKSNVEEAEKLYRMFEGRPKIKVTVSTRLFPRDDGDLTPCDMHISEEDELRLYRMQLGRRAEDAGQKLLSMPVVNFQPERSRTCGAGRTLIVILPNGDVLPCVHLGGLKMGNVRERPVSAIWLDNDAVRELRAITLASFKECQSCELISVCPHCPAMSLVETGSLTGWSSQICQATKTFWAAAREKLRAEGKELML
jgi:radical SAM protein with 4Fe4S-binding SPASM domain